MRKTATATENFTPRLVGSSTPERIDLEPAGRGAPSRADGFSRTQGPSGAASKSVEDTQSPSGLGQYVGSRLRRFGPAVAAVAIGAALVISPALAKADPPAASPATVATVRVPEVKTTTTRPLTITAGVGFPEALNLGVNYNFNDYFALGGHVGTAKIWNDYGLHARLYPIGTRRFHPYLEGGADLFDLSALHGGTAIIPEGRLGFEFRGDHGFTLTLDGGAGVPVTGVSRAPIPVFGLALGYSF